MINWDPLEEVEEWWDSMDIASKKTIAQILKVKLSFIKISGNLKKLIGLFSCSKAQWRQMARWEL